MSEIITVDLSKTYVARKRIAADNVNGPWLAGDVVTGLSEDSIAKLLIVGAVEEKEEEKPAEEVKPVKKRKSKVENKE